MMLCDFIWQVMFSCSEIGSREQLYTFNALTFAAFIYAYMNAANVIALNVYSNGTCKNFSMI